MNINISSIGLGVKPLDFRRCFSESTPARQFQTLHSSAAFQILDHTHFAIWKDKGHPIVLPACSQSTGALSAMLFSLDLMLNPKKRHPLTVTVGFNSVHQTLDPGTRPRVQDY